MRKKGSNARNVVLQVTKTMSHVATHSRDNKLNSNEFTISKLLLKSAQLIIREKGSTTLRYSILMKGCLIEGLKVTISRYKGRDQTMTVFTMMAKTS